MHACATAKVGRRRSPPTYCASDMSSDEEIENAAAGEEGWDDWEDDGEGDETYVCLFCAAKNDSVAATFGHMTGEHGFSFQGVRKQGAMEFYECVKMINYIRSEVKEGRKPCEADFAKGGAGAGALEGDKYLIPAMQDDALMFGFDEEAVVEEDALATQAAAAEVSEVDLLRAENESLKARLDAIKQTMFEDEDGAGSDGGPPDAESLSGSEASSDGPPDAEDLAGGGVGGGKVGDKQKKRDKKAINDGYFGSYSYFGIHREMISDTARTSAYQGALEGNPSLVAGATVLDVGCGTGILSMFAARGGAAKVVAVDGSERIAGVARVNAADNGFGPGPSGSPGTIEVVSGVLEKLPGLPVPDGSVDVIVSEWMGYALLFECMFDTVVYARDKWLKPGGCVLPDEAVMYVAGAGLGATGLDFWDSVYGFSMRHIRDTIHSESMKSAVVEEVPAKHVVTPACAFKTFDLCTVTLPELDFTSEYELRLEEGAAGGDTEAVWALVLWFDTNFTARYWCADPLRPPVHPPSVLWFVSDFTARYCKEKPVVLSTSPHATPTHWQQTLLYLRKPITLARGGKGPAPAEGAEVGSEGAPAACFKGLISVTRSARYRGIDIGVTVQAVGGDGRAGATENLLFHMD